MKAFSADLPLARLALAAGLALLPVGCGGYDQPLIDTGASTSSEDPSHVTPEAAGAVDEAAQQAVVGLEAAKQHWESLDIADYTLKVRRACFCAPQAEDHVSVSVRDNHLVAAFAQSATGEYDIPVEMSSMRAWYTVPGMFARIESNLGTADRVSVVYDSALGYPSELMFDYQEASADEGEYFQMWDFSPQ